MTTKFEKINGVIFPVTYTDDGLVIIDYPSYNEEVSKKITKEGQKNLKKI